MIPQLTLIMGCTASGKGKLAFELARRWGAEIISIDSMKVYRRMDIGTAKPSMDRREQVPHHLIDVVEPWESFSVGRYVELADKARAEIQDRQRPIISAGGTALYIRAMLEGLFDGPPANAEIRDRLQTEAQTEGTHELHRRLTEIDPEAAGKIHPNDLKRIVRALEVWELTGKPISSYHGQFRSGKYRHPWRLIGLRREPADASGRINQRVKKMVAEGLVEEVKSLLAEPKGLSEQASQAVGYAEIINYLRHGGELQDAVEKIKINTRRLAKSQRTWFRSFAEVLWVDAAVDDTVERVADRVEAMLGK
ncbi:MAG: tRNA (adenosine(37)-N6)-dimethylallyltransferase MiaA [Sedimentisphaerales bacterium]|nr:tRNA (adenosine(37)-N6)-dimethylallyltransferase MiaA [Sedimentisphaerales bacterium]